ncbi:MAG: glycosyltransferase, partial [Elusimicrobia bacterium]|nr:glycosyltransferase [Elusimicrobiota bacterium]
MYVSPNGVGTALVRSQVLPYLRSLREAGIETTLVAFERGEPFPEGEFRPECWVALRPWPGASLAAKLVDILRGTLSVIWVVVRRHADVVHARSYLPAAIALAAARVTGRPYIFDMRGFLGEEYVDAGLWTASDLRYRALRFAEQHLLRGASGIVVLTEVAARRLRADPRYASRVSGTPIAVIPCAVDLDRFRPLAHPGSVPTLVYSGSLGMWYLLDEMLAVYAHARRLVPRLRFLILNRGEAELVRRAADRLGPFGRDVEVRAADFSEMPGLIAAAHVGIALLRQVPSKVGSSPIKIAEYLACGLPVIVNAGLGDSDEQIRSYRAGHVVEGYAAPDLERAGEAVARLLDDAE